jgi:tetratricopeptide (TPR) repeat protein
MSRKPMWLNAALEKVLLAGLVSVFLVASAEPALAQRDDDEEEGGSPAGSFDERTAEILQEAIELLNMENYAGARASIGELRLDRLSPYERSTVEQILFNIEYASENYDAARSHLQQAISAGGLNEQQVQNMRFQIAQTFMVEERWAEGAQALEEWFRTATDPNSQAYYLLAVAYYSMGDLRKALPPAERAVELAENPQESWLQLVVALYLQQERWRDALPYLERLVAIAPQKKDNWVRLSSVYGQLEDYGQALAAMQIPYSSGLLTEDSEFTRLADLAQLRELPYRGGVILEKAIAENKVAGTAQNYEKLGNMWIAAREYDKAVGPLERAAGMARTGDTYVRLAQVHLQRDNFAAASSALQRALDKGGLRDTENARYLMGVALYSQDRFADAKPLFEAIRDSEELGESAEGFIDNIDAKLAQLEEEEAAADDEASSEEDPASPDAPAEEPAPSTDEPAAPEAPSGDAPAPDASPEEPSAPASPTP